MDDGGLVASSLKTRQSAKHCYFLQTHQCSRVAPCRHLQFGGPISHTLVMHHTSQPLRRTWLIYVKYSLRCFCRHSAHLDVKEVQYVLDPFPAQRNRLWAYIPRYSSRERGKRLSLGWAISSKSVTLTGKSHGSNSDDTDKTKYSACVAVEAK
eukprot:209548-Pleurochrysis_carterae.AAC.2